MTQMYAYGTYYTLLMIVSHIKNISYFVVYSYVAIAT